MGWWLAPGLIGTGALFTAAVVVHVRTRRAARKATRS